jgi:hypothetical protein
MYSTTTLHEFQYGEIVYLIHDSEQIPRMVINLTIFPILTYTLKAGTECSDHYEEEISREKLVG